MTDQASRKLYERHKDFFESVYMVVREIPEGRVTSYGAIASYLGAKRSARMVGWAMNASYKSPGVPAHRVVNREGLLSGKHHFADADQMENLLKREGVEVRNDRVVDFKLKFWDPSRELEVY
ncbi:MAG: MGMT family protein [Bacteroidetes bacterium]|nr:MAG: MGMT family protein [Bacteroidota bacterium]